MKDTHKDTDFMGKFDFGEILERNHKKNERTPISDLLRPTTQIVEQDAEKQIDNIDINLEKVDIKMERVEALVQSLIISQQNFQSNMMEELKKMKSENLLEHKEAEKVSIEQIQEDTKQDLYKYLSVAFASVILTITIANFGKNKTTPVKSKESVTKQEVVKVQEEKVIATPIQNQYVATKFVNLRDQASSKATILSIISPNSVLTLIQSKFGWHQVSFKDHLAGKTKMGWIYGENLKKIK
jgi:hypothetical protein